MIAQPEALLLADLLKTRGLDPGSTVRKDAAAELRRLHSENEALRKDLKTEHALSFRDQVASLQAELESKDALLRQALELLEDNREDVARVETTYMHKCYDPVLYAIRQHLGQKGATK